MKSQVSLRMSYHFSAVLAATEAGRLHGSSAGEKNPKTHLLYKCDLYVAQITYVAKAW